MGRVARQTGPVSVRGQVFLFSRNDSNVKQYYIDILTNPTGTLYIGLTKNLQRRIDEHKHKQVVGFTKKYNITRLVYLEQTEAVQSAIARE